MADTPGTEEATTVQDPPVIDSEEAIIEKIKSEPGFAEQFIEDATAILTDPSVAKPPEETPPATETTEEKPPEEKKADEEEISVAIKPSWLGTYGKNRSMSEGVQELSKAVGEKQKLIERYEIEELPTLRNDIAKKDEEIAELRSKVEAAEKAPPPASTPPASTPPESTPPPEQKQEEPKGPELEEVPALPDYPKVLTGDDAFDEEKIIEYQKKQREYNEAVQNANEIKTRNAIKKATWDTTQGLNTQFAERETNLRNEIKGLKDGVQKIETTTQKASEKQTQDSRVVAEYEEIDSLRNSPEYVEVLGGRPIQAMEASYIEFLRVLSREHGIEGDIYSNANGKPIIRPEVTQALNLYNSEHLEAGKQLRQKLDSIGIKLPDDYDTLKKIYRLRNYKIQHNYSYQEALNILKNTDPMFSPAAKAEKETQPQREEQEARERAAASRKGAREPDPSVGANPTTRDKMLATDFMKILNKKRDQRTDHETEVLKQEAKARATANPKDGSEEMWLKAFDVVD